MVKPKDHATASRRMVYLRPLVYINESQALHDATYPQSGEYRRCQESTQCQLSWQYLYDHSPTIKRRLSMAGIRIAAYLNTLFAPPSK